MASTNDFTITGDYTTADLNNLSAALAYLQTSPTGASVVQAAADNHDTINIIHNGDDGELDGGDSGDVINWDPNSGLQLSDGSVQSPALGLGHEFGHSTLPDGEDNTPDAQYGHVSDRVAITQAEDPIAHDLGEPTRDDHGGAATEGQAPTDHTPTAGDAPPVSGDPAGDPGTDPGSDPGDSGGDGGGDGSGDGGGDSGGGGGGDGGGGDGDGDGGGGDGGGNGGGGGGGDESPNLPDEEADRASAAHGHSAAASHPAAQAAAAHTIAAIEAAMRAVATMAEQSQGQGDYAHLVAVQHTEQAPATVGYDTYSQSFAQHYDGMSVQALQDAPHAGTGGVALV